MIHSYPVQGPLVKPIPPLEMRNAVKAILPLSLTPINEPLIVAASGDTLFTYDMSDEAHPELVGEITSHWHDITHLRIWIKTTSSNSDEPSFEPIVVSSSLDGTVRKWTLQGC